MDMLLYYRGNAASDKQGLGVEKPGELNDDDDEYAAYRKRMVSFVNE